jgi:hypothetical protein
MDQAALDTRPRRRWKIVGWTAVTLLLIVLAAGAWVATRVLAVRDELSAVADLQAQARDALDDGDVPELSALVDEMQIHTEAAASTAGDPIWRAAEILPFVGANLQAVRVVAEQFDVLSTDVAAPLVSVLGDLESRGLIADGAIDVDLIESARGPATQASEALASAQERIESLPRDSLLADIAAGVDDVLDVTRALSVPVSSVADLTQVLPGILGSGGDRSILVMFQNNAELRTGGGITGTFAEIRADRGALTIVRQADSSEFRPVDKDVLEIPSSTSEAYGDVVGRYVQNTTSTPDFDLSARLAARWWENLTGHSPDVVLSIDPLVLRSLLDVTGPVKLRGGAELTREDFVQDVMIAPYFRLEPKEQSAYFADLTDRFFAALMSTDVAPSTWIEAVARPVDQGRISVWSAHDDEAAVLAGTAVAGPRARHLAAGESAFAVYLNDTTGAKMGSRLRVAMNAAATTCRDDDRPEVAIAVRLTNDAPAKAATWPLSMTGGGHWGVTPGHIGTIVTAVAPEGWFFSGVRVDGELTGSTNVVDEGLPSSAVEVTLAPGESADVELRFTAPDTDAVEPELLHTPLIRALDDEEFAPAGCN